MRVLFFTLLICFQSLALASGPSKGLLEDLRLLKMKESKRFFLLRNQLIKTNSAEVTDLKAQFNEHKNRTDLLDRLIFYTDSHFKGGNEKSFLKSACLKLAEREVQDIENNRSGHWEFFRNMADVIQDAGDSDLSATSLLESYMNFASVTKPKAAKGFLGPRDYTNGVTYETAKSVSIDQVGDIVSLPQNQEPLGQPQLKPVFITETERPLEKN